MRIFATFALLTTSLAAAWAQPSSGFAPTLSRAQITAAMQAGQALFREGRGYQAPHHVLFAGHDTLRIQKGQGPVEAIIVGTPYERVKYASYLQAFQGRGVSLPWAQSIAQRDANLVQFVVFAHGDSARDRNFLRRFSDGRLQLGRFTELTSPAPTTFGPALDFYNVDGSGRQFRWLGSATFRFNLSSLIAHGFNAAHTAGTFSFTDSDGVSRHYRVDLTRYR